MYHTGPRIIYIFASRYYLLFVYEGNEPFRQSFRNNKKNNENTNIAYRSRHYVFIITSGF